MRDFCCTASSTSCPPRCACRFVLSLFVINDLITAFLVAFAAVTASDLLTRIWEYF
jgi:hypothetical protein